MNKKQSTIAHLHDALKWLKRAQDATDDFGVAAWFSILSGWNPSYIETTGYIINTFLEASRFFEDHEYFDRALKMADFLVAMQHSTGGYRSVVPSQAADSAPTVFNTGQDLLGLAQVALLTKKEKYLQSIVAAADFLVSIQEQDGSWVLYTYGNTNHAYHTRVAWALIMVAKVCKKLRPHQLATNSALYTKAAIKNLNWALTLQNQNGWISNAHLPAPHSINPFTHTISYAIEGLLWSGLELNNAQYIKAALRAAYPPLMYFLTHDYLPGSFTSNWESNDAYTCLTGNAQLSLVWLTLYSLTRRKTFLTAARLMNRSLESIQSFSHWSTNTRGAIPGSWPIWGDLLRNSGYCRMAYPNWAAKFFADAPLLELSLEAS